EMGALADVGLAERAHIPAGELSHGEKRALELAIALALQPKVLLLDEPMAGTGREETARLVEMLRRLKGRFSVVLGEHDMTAVFALADRISGLIYGRILASGAPAGGRADPRVVAAYLGAAVGRGGMLAVDHLQAAYGPAQVLFDICLRVGAGEVVTLLGRNGMGKTTTIRTLMGLLPACGGSAAFEGVSLIGLPPYRIAQAGLGFV